MTLQIKELSDKFQSIEYISYSNDLKHTKYISAIECVKMYFNELIKYAQNKKEKHYFENVKKEIIKIKLSGK